MHALEKVKEGGIGLVMKVIRFMIEHGQSAERAAARCGCQEERCFRVLEKRVFPSVERRVRIVS
jgi:hypothetical protein